jgi:YD repeat-containing protein
MFKRRAVNVLRPFIALFYKPAPAANVAASAHRSRKARYAQYVAKATPARRLACFIACFGLILSSLPTVPAGLGKSAEKPRAHLTKGPPGLNLPDLNELRRMRPGVPRIAPPVSAPFASKMQPSFNVPPPTEDENWPMDFLKDKNRVGTAPEDLLSRNFNWGAPIVSLPGRAGMDLDLGLSLNSLIWTRSGNNMYFNLGGSFPSPGFRLGLPELGATFYNPEAGTPSALVTMPSGRRYEFRLNPAYDPDIVYEEMGSTYMQLVVEVDPLNDLDVTWNLLLTDGTTYKFRPVGNNFKCVEVKDRNGNFISVSYTPSEQIKDMRDTVGRLVKFKYDGSDRLTSITQDWAGGEHTYATFAYEVVTIQTNFPGLDLVGAANGATVPALSRMTMADGKVYAFEYNSYAQVKVIKCYAPSSESPIISPEITPCCRRSPMT